MRTYDLEVAGQAYLEVTVYFQYSDLKTVMP